jgi:hypothetical protein
MGCAAPRADLPLPNPATYAEDIPEPTLPQDATNGDLTAWGALMKSALGQANADRASLRAWASTIKENKQ